MKTLLENWKRFIKEQEEVKEYDYDAEVAKEREELEQKHFGASANIGKMLHDIYQKEMDYLKSQGADPDDIIDEHDNIFDVVQAKFNNLILQIKFLQIVWKILGVVLFVLYFHVIKITL